MSAQSAATVPVASDVYRRIEAISAIFPFRGLHLGQRPMSRRELGRVLDRLSEAVERAPHDHRSRAWAQDEVSWVRDVLAQTNVGAPVGGRVQSSLQAWLSGSDARDERVGANGLGSLDAITNPFVRPRGYWSAPNGIALSIASTTVIDIREWLAIAAEPRLTMNANGGDRDLRAAIHRGYARAVLKNVSLQLGGDEVRWGQSPYGALFVSGNAPPGPAIALGNDTAFTLPGVFRLAGPLRVTGMLADLGPTQDPPHAKLAGWQVSVQPWSRFELGVSVLAHTGGGAGIPTVSFLERVADLFPVIGAAFPSYDNPISNKLAGGNLRLRLPELSGMDLYYELQFDDFDGRRLASSFIDDAGHLLGGRMGAGSLVGRAEWHRTSVRLYEHTQFRSGVTHRQRFIGSPLGPNAKAAYLGAEWRVSPSIRVDLTLADERRDPSQYSVITSGSRDRGFRFVRVTDEQDVRRARVVGMVERGLSVGAFRIAGGYNRAWRGGQPSRHEWLGQLSLASSVLPTF